MYFSPDTISLLTCRDKQRPLKTDLFHTLPAPPTVAYLLHPTRFGAQALPVLGLQQSDAPKFTVVHFPDLNSYPKGDFYPVFHTLLQHKRLLLVTLQVTCKEGRW